MKIPKKLHVALLILLIGRLIYNAFQMEWFKLFDGTFEWKSLQGFSVSLLVLLVLIFQYKSTAEQEKQKDK
ncbi:hypothetical protein [Psychroflexus salis]|nr:hypothetical protein [Psychroflexus salis]